MYINDFELNNSILLNSSRTIQIKYNDFKDICNDKIQICVLSLNIISDNLNQDSFIQIEINSKSDKDEEENKKEVEDDKDDDDNKNTVLIIVFSFLGFCIIIVIIYVMLRCKRKNNNLNEEINNAFVGETELKDNI